MLLNKGAMFGLDARIALAIFGALSVISGAALYSAIQTSKVEMYRQYFVEVGKASEQYYLDTGQELTEFAKGAVESSQLVNNRLNLSNWNGPYIAYDDYLSTYLSKFFTSSITKQIHSSVTTEMGLLLASTWAANSSAQVCVTNDADCSEYIILHVGDSSTRAEAAPKVRSVYEMMDKLIDNSDGALAGKIRLLDYGSDNIYICYQTRVRKSTYV